MLVFDTAMASGMPSTIASLKPYIVASSVTQPLDSNVCQCLSIASVTWVDVGKTEDGIFHAMQRTHCANSAVNSEGCKLRRKFIRSERAEGSYVNDNTTYVNS